MENHEVLLRLHRRLDILAVASRLLHYAGNQKHVRVYSNTNLRTNAMAYSPYPLWRTMASTIQTPYTAQVLESAGPPHHVRNHAETGRLKVRRCIWLLQGKV